MKKPILITLFLAGLAFLAGCVHPNDLETIAPSTHSSATTQSQA
jgi:hypothetical protein